MNRWLPCWLPCWLRHHWTCSAVPPGEQGGKHALVDSDGHARTGYDVDGDALVLVRPDDYVGLFAVPGTLDQLDDYLRLLTNTSLTAY